MSINVVVGILKKDNKYLFCERPLGKPYCGYWEFPGGKVEYGEQKKDALKREIFEELDIYIDLDSTIFIFQSFHSYEHADVNLYFYLINKWNGNIISKEQQKFEWLTKDNINKKILPSLENILNNLLI